MKFAYFNPLVMAIEDVDAGVFTSIKESVDKAHEKKELNDEGDPNISIRGGQQIQLVPNSFNLDTSVLKTFVEKQSKEYFENVLQVNGQTELSNYQPTLVSAWTIKQSEGNYQALHSHESHISGNIYIDIPYLDDHSNPSDSCLEFKLPVIKNTNTFHFVDSWRFKPQAMKMVIFPSYVPHTVYPWKGQGNRTILAWDVKLVKSN